MVIENNSVKNIFKNQNEEERKNALTKLYIEIIQKLIKLNE